MLHNHWLTVTVQTVVTKEIVNTFPSYEEFCLQVLEKLGDGHLPSSSRFPVNSLTVPPVYSPLQVYSLVCCWYLEVQLVLPGI